MRENEHVLKKYLDKIGLNLTQFAIKSRVSLPTLHRIVKRGSPPRYENVKKIVIATKNEITFEDFGFNKATRKRIRASESPGDDISYDPGKADAVASPVRRAL
jgi:hypothetical protein